jgi:hypothetical protein
VDYYNAQTVAERQSLPQAHIEKEWTLSLDQIKRAIQEMPDDKFTQEIVYPWGPKGSVEGLIRIFTDHEREHAADIRKLKGQADRGKLS